MGILGAILEATGALRQGVSELTSVVMLLSRYQLLVCLWGCY